MRLATLVVVVGGVLVAAAALAQENQNTAKATKVRITQGPELERVDPDCAIIRWTSDNPGGSPQHDGVVHYGTDPTKLTQLARSPIRLNPGRALTVFRVRMEKLIPKTTYYYTVESMESNGTSDGVQSAVKQLTTP